MPFFVLSLDLPAPPPTLSLPTCHILGSFSCKPERTTSIVTSTSIRSRNLHWHHDVRRLSSLTAVPSAGAEPPWPAGASQCRDAVSSMPLLPPLLHPPFGLVDVPRVDRLCKSSCQHSPKARVDSSSTSPKLCPQRSVPPASVCLRGLCG